jgi:hypothetical protein
VTAEVIELWGGSYEIRMRRPHEQPCTPLEGSATIIMLPVVTPRTGKRRVRLRVVEARTRTLQQ